MAGAVLQERAANGACQRGSDPCDEVIEVRAEYVRETGELVGRTDHCCTEKASLAALRCV